MLRIRITFTKTNAMRFTSHLDLHRTLERTIRRAQLPLIYSQGFNPRPKINLAAALPLGITSDNELADIWLYDILQPDFIIKQLQEASPPGIEFKKGEIIDLKTPKLPNLVIASNYEITLIEPVTNLSKRLRIFNSMETFIRERRGKEYDLIPLVHSIEEIDLSQNGEQRISLLLAAVPGATGRPDEVLAALDIPLTKTRIHRKKIFLSPDKIKPSSITKSN